MEKDYKKTGWVNGSEPDMDAEHMNNIEDGIDGLYHPVFDDSGTVEGITNFPQFLSTVVNKMNPIAFYKNFKAGMAFVLHAGQLVNNGLCNEPGKYPLDAAYGKTLYDYYDRLNSDIGDKANTSELANYFPKAQICPVYLSTAASNGYITKQFPWPLKHTDYAIVSDVAGITISNRKVDECTFYKESWGNNIPWAAILVFTKW